MLALALRTDVESLLDFKTAYPSPTLTPAASCVPSPYPTSPKGNKHDLFSISEITVANISVDDMPRSPALTPEPLPATSHIFKKRKTSPPVCSIKSCLPDSEREKLRIFKLDVFEAFSTRPKSLLYRSKSRKQGATSASGSRKITRSNSNILGNNSSILNSGLQFSSSSSLNYSDLPATKHRNFRKNSFASCSDSSKNSSGTDDHGGIAKPLPGYLNDPELGKYLDPNKFKNTKNAPLVCWKGHPLSIDPKEPRYDDLTSEELRTCVTLRLRPIHYLHIKETLLKASVRGPYKKRDAQGWFRIDVNKTNKVYDWFVTIGWIPCDPKDWSMDRFMTFPSDTTINSAISSV